MHGTFPRSEASAPVVLCLQGGGALGAFSAGVVETLILHPAIKLVGASGTSSGAITARALVNGYIDGLRYGDLDDARQSAANNVRQTWDGLVKCQNVALWYSSDHPFFSSMPASMRTHMRDVLSIYGPKLDAPLMKFYQSLDRQGQDVTPATNASSPFLAVNATFYQPGQSPWDAKASDEKIFWLNGLSKEVQHRGVAASGALNCFKPVNIDGALYQDGAYASPIPDPAAMARLAEKNNAALVIVRTRPAGAYGFHGEREGSENWMRAFFNTKMDAAVDKLREDFPRLKISIVEPDKVEADNGHLLNNETRFDKTSIARRFREGRAVASRVMQSDLGLAACEAALEVTAPYAAPKSAYPGLAAAAALVTLPAATSLRIFSHAMDAAYQTLHM